MTTWNSQEAKKATGGLVNSEWVANDLVIDTRSLRKGDIFIALKGTNTDGHNFLEHAKQQGAAAVMVEHDPPIDMPYLKVHNTYQAIDDMCNFRRNETNATFIAVTGSVGKTSTREMVYQCLSKLGKCHTTIRNYNNRLGLPICLASMPKESDYGVFELAMRHSGEIKELSTILKPDIAIITNIALAHIAQFSSLQDIANAKAEIFLGMNEGIAILPSDDDFYELLKNLATQRGLMVISCGNKGDCQVLDIKNLNNSKSIVTAKIIDETIIFTVGSTAPHLINNALFALATVKAMNQDLHKAAAALERFSALPGRGQISTVVFDNKKITLIDDSYNASFKSMVASIEFLAQQQGRKVAILADMLELGEHGIEYHKRIASIIAENNIDKVITLGTLSKHIYDTLPQSIRIAHCQSIFELKEIFRNNIQKSDTVLIKGSNSTKLYELVNFIQELQNVS